MADLNSLMADPTAAAPAPEMPFRFPGNGTPKPAPSPAAALAAPPVPDVPPVTYRAFSDIAGQRRAIYDRARGAVQGNFVESPTHRLEIVDADYAGEDVDPSISDEKRAILEQGRLARTLRGTLRLTDKASGKVLDERKTTLAHIPHLTNEGLFIDNGTSWHIRNQQRQGPGVYTNRKQDGRVEARLNVKRGTGAGWRMELEPESGLFKVRIGQSTTRLYPVLKALGVQDDDLKKAWGPELFDRNWRDHSGHDNSDVSKLIAKLGRKSDQAEAPESAADQAQRLRGILKRQEFDEDNTELTLGRRVKNLDEGALVGITEKILKVARGGDGDNGDSLAFQSFHPAEDLFAERLKLDPAKALRKALYRASARGNLEGVQSGLLNPSLRSLLHGTGLAQPVEDINPLEIHDLRQGITRGGEGGISSEAVSPETREVQPSHLGFIDPSRAPESSNIGLDMRVGGGARIGSDGKLYTQVRNPKTGEIEHHTARTLTQKIVAFPGEMARNTKRVRAMVGEDIQYVPRAKVDFEIPHASNLISRLTAMVPMVEGDKSARLAMGARMQTQALGLEDADSPLVTMGDEAGDFHEQLGAAMGARRAERAGRVVKIEPDAITLRNADDGSESKVSLWNNYPTARKSLKHNTPTVYLGQEVNPGDLVARSNFTDKEGRAAVGKNLRIGMMVGEGNTFDDSVVVSEEAAKKLTSTHGYKFDRDHDDSVKTTRTDAYRALFGNRFTPEQFAKLDENGAVKVGETLNPGDPITLMVQNKPARAVGALTSSGRSSVADGAQVWDHDQPGVVTDVVNTRKGTRIQVSSTAPLKEGDKISGRHGNKGIVAEIRPDADMPHDSQGRPLHVLLSSMGIISRTNASALAETLLGKISEKTGQRYSLKPFEKSGDLEGWSKREAQKHGVTETEDLVDPRDGRVIKGVTTGIQHIMKLHHTAESKLSSRDTGGYASDDSPARGGDDGAKQIGMLSVYSLLSHGATEFLKDAKLVRGQRNDDYWRSLKQGGFPNIPTKSFANENFRALLKGAGVNIRDQGDGRERLAPITDKDVDELAQHEIDNPETFDFNTMKPIPGGLFDLGKTGGADGKRWSKITLPAPIPNPLMEQPIARLLGIPATKLNAVLAGRDELAGLKGPAAVSNLLKGLNVDREIERAKQEIGTSSRGARDNAVKRLGFLTGLKRNNLEPKDLLLTRMPVLPPKFRPVIRLGGMDRPHDANHLYHDLLVARQNYSDAVKHFGSAPDEYETMYQAARAVSGITDPVNPKSQEMGVKGMLRLAIGQQGSAKGARYQRKVLGGAVDLVGRGTATIDPELHMDHVKLPEEQAWKQFRPFVIRRLVRQGMPSAEAVKAVKERTKQADAALETEMGERPVVYNRAPELHRYNYVGAWAKRHPGSSIAVPQAPTKGLNLDFDGDNLNVHVPSSSEAVKEVLAKLLPSKNLWHTSNFEAHMTPNQEFAMGLWLAGKRDDKRPTQKFKTEADAEAAWKAGKLSLRDPIDITG